MNSFAKLVPVLVYYRSFKLAGIYLACPLGCVLPNKWEAATVLAAATGVGAGSFVKLYRT